MFESKVFAYVCVMRAKNDSIVGKPDADNEFDIGNGLTFQIELKPN